MQNGDAGPQLELAVRLPAGKEILPAGTALSDETLCAVAAAGREQRWEQRCLLEHGTIRDDLALATRIGSYATVFGSEREYRDLEGLMARVSLVEPLLQGLDWFKTNDVYTYRHVLAVFALSLLLSVRFGRNEPDTALQAVAGPLHDIGKLCVPRPVLVKRTALTRPERRQLEQHTLAGHVLLCYFFGDEGDQAARVARDHHERRDGSGYPRGIALEDTLVEIVAICDIYDALVSPRPYRSDSFDNRSALEELTAMADSGRFDPDVVRLLIALNRKERPEPGSCVLAHRKRGASPAGNLYGVFADRPER